MNRLKNWVGRLPQVATAATVAILLGGVFVISAPSAGDGSPTPSRPLVVATFTPSPAEGYRVEREFVGRVEANRESHVGFELAGLVETIRVDDGDHVVTGQALASLDTDLLEARRAEVASGVAQARAALELAQSTVLRHREAARLNAISTQALDEAEQTLTVRRAALAEAEAGLNSIDVAIRKSTLRAPYDAVVASRLVDEGQVVEAGTPLFHLLERANPTARIALSGSSVGALAGGDSVTLQIGDRDVSGLVKTVLPVRGRTTRSIEALIRLDVPLNGIRQGDLAAIRLAEPVETAGFWLPLEALTESSRGLWSVYVVREARDGVQTIRRRELEVLHQEAGRVFARGTLAAGEQIVIDGTQRLVPDQQVTVAPSSSSHSGAAR